MPLVSPDGLAGVEGGAGLRGRGGARDADGRRCRRRSMRRGARARWRRRVAASGGGVTRTWPRSRVFASASDIPLLSGDRTGVRQGTRPGWRAKPRASAAVQQLPSSLRCSAACGTWSAANLRSTAAGITSRMSEPPMPASATAACAMISRSKASTMKGEGRTPSVRESPEADLLAVPAGDLGRIRAPAQVGGRDRDLAAGDAAFPATGGPLERQAVRAENAQHPLVVDWPRSRGAALAVEERRDAPVAVGRACIDEATDRREQRAILGPMMPAAPPRRPCRPCMEP